MLRHKKVLVVLDDANNMEQLEFFVGDHDHCCFGPGSRIIITSRDKQILKKFVHVIYEVKELNCDDSLHLVSWSAFKQKNPLEDFVALTNLVVRYARGNPLALKVLGSMLFGKSKTEWESALKKLEKAPHKDIQDVLKITYDKLDEEEKDIFLHIACLFEGEDIDHVVQAIDGCGFSTNIGISTLIDKSLLTISNNKLEMHDLLQQMGREIVRQESKRPNDRSRIWNRADIYKVFKENNGTEAIEGILLEMSKTGKLELNANAFARIPNLKFLIFRMSDFHCGFEEDCEIKLPKGLEYLPSELRYLYWHGYPLESLPANFHPLNLVELNLPCSKVEQLWEEAEASSSISQLSKLTFMSLRYCKNIRSLPTNIGLPSLETLDLSGCSNLKKFPEVSQNIRYLYLNETAIQEVPLSIEYLSKLVLLDMKNCTKLESLPGTICNLKSLQIFILSGCTNLVSFPEILETMDSLQYLFLDETAIITLPDSFSNMEALHVLNLSDCSKLERLPKDIKDLKFLAELRAGGCNLSKLPADFKYLSSVIELNLSGNNFESMPAGIDQLSKLRWLNVSGCKRLQSLPELPTKMKYLNARDCRSLESISGLKQLFELGCNDSLGDETFVFTNCYKLNQDEWRDVVEHAQLKIQHFAMRRKHSDCKTSVAPFVCFTYPGTEIPEWFTRKSNGSSVTIHRLPPYWLNCRFLGFAVCMVVTFDDRLICDFPRGVVACKCHFRNDYGGLIHHIFTLDSWKYFPAKSNGSKHVCLWYDCRWYDTIVAKCDWLNECGCNEVSFEFSAEILDCHFDANGHKVGSTNFPQVEKCGVRLLYAKDEESNHLEMEVEMTKKRSGKSGEEEARYIKKKKQ